QPSILPDIQYPDISNWKEVSLDKENRVGDCSNIYPNFLTYKIKDTDNQNQPINMNTDLSSFVANEHEPITYEAPNSLTPAIEIASPEFVNLFRSHSVSPGPFFLNPNEDLDTADTHQSALNCEVVEATMTHSNVPIDSPCRMSPLTGIADKQ